MNKWKRLHLIWLIPVRCIIYFFGYIIEAIDDIQDFWEEPTLWEE